MAEPAITGRGLRKSYGSNEAVRPSGIGLSGRDVGALVLWGLGGIWIAARSFKWEPQGRSPE